MRIVHLTASTFFGGPERQMLGLARALPAGHRTAFLSFAEGGRCAAFLDEVRRHGFDGHALSADTPRLRAAVRDAAGHLRRLRADVLVCHGYKANILGRPAARRGGCAAVAVARGWTGENLKVRAYEAIDRLHLRFMDRVVCVSEGQARKVLSAGVSADKVVVIRNAARLHAFADPDPADRDRLRAFLPAVTGPLVCAAGRLSPEKGFAVLAEAAARVNTPGAGFVLFGEGAERPAIEKRVAELGMSERFTLAGFSDDLDRLLPWADVVVLPSFTEGLPNVALEASAAGVPVVATAVGGTPEVVRDGETGYLVPPGDPAALAARIDELLADAAVRRRMGEAGRALMHAEFTFEAQARQYLGLFESIVGERLSAAA